MKTKYLPFEFQTHEPEKFTDYTEVGAGFILTGQKFQYLYDEKKGWCDQNGCYYDQDGKPDGWIILSENREKYKLFSMDKEQLSEGDNKFYLKFSESYQRNKKQIENQKNKNKQHKGQNEIFVAKEEASASNVELKKKESEKIEIHENQEQQKQQKNKGKDKKYNKTEQKIINDEKNKERAGKKNKNYKNDNPMPKNIETQQTQYIKKSELEEQQNKQENAEVSGEDKNTHDDKQEQNDDNNQYNSKYQKKQKKPSPPIIIDIKNREENLTDDELIANIIAISNIQKEAILQIKNDQLYFKTIEDAIVVFLQNQEQIKSKSNKYIIEL